MFRAILIDDEIHALKTLRWEIEQHCSEIEILAAFSQPEEALQGIKDLRPDLIFLDIEMPRMSGFDLVSRLPVDLSADVIFITAYDKYAIQAFKISAFDYFLKPFEGADLKETIQRLQDKRKRSEVAPPQQVLQDRLSKLKANLGRIAIPKLEGLEMLRPEEIIYCHSEGAYTKIILLQRNVLMSKNIKVLESLLVNFPFFRIHKSYLVNLHEVRGFYKDQGAYVEMSNGDQLPVARRKKKELLSIFNTDEN